MNIVIQTLLLCLSLSTTSYGSEPMPTMTGEQFVAFLDSAEKTHPIDDAAITDFYTQAFPFWLANLADMNDHPDQYRSLLAHYHRVTPKFPMNAGLKLDRYESTIEAFRQFDDKNIRPAKPVLFVGSSSIAYWKTALAFPHYPVINRGFGGASLSEILYYYDDVVKKHNPSVIVIYCDIDIENGASPTETLALYQQLLHKMNTDFPDAEIILLSMKPTMLDDVLGLEVRPNKAKANSLLVALSQTKKQLHYVDVGSAMLLADGRQVNSVVFSDDGMHINEKGYAQWNRQLDGIIGTLLVGRK